LLENQLLGELILL